MSATTVLASGFKHLAGIAATDSLVFFTEQEIGRLIAVPLAGGPPLEVFNGHGAPAGVTVADGFVSWCDHTPTEPGIVRRASVVSLGVPPTNISMVKRPFAIASAASGVVVAAAFAGTGSNSGEVHEFVLNGPSIPIDVSNPLGVAAYGQELYWTDTSIGTIGHATMGKSNNAALATGEADCRSIAADDQGVYWTRPTDSKIRAKLGTGGTVIDLASGEKGPSSLATDAQNVYWVTQDGQIRRKARSPGAPVEVVAVGSKALTEIHTQALALTKNYVVWLTDDGQVLRKAK